MTTDPEKEFNARMERATRPTPAIPPPPPPEKAERGWSWMATAMILAFLVFIAMVAAVNRHWAVNTAETSLKEEKAKVTELTTARDKAVKEAAENKAILLKEARSAITANEWLAEVLTTPACIPQGPRVVFATVGPSGGTCFVPTMRAIVRIEGGKAGGQVALTAAQVRAALAQPASWQGKVGPYQALREGQHKLVVTLP